MLRRNGILLIGVLLLASQGRSQQPAPTIEQCRTTANYLATLSPAGFAKLQKQMTAGDELVYSTQLAKCLDGHSSTLSAAHMDTLERITYKLDADVIGRMDHFLQRHNMEDKFNDEEEARKLK